MTSKRGWPEVSRPIRGRVRPVRRALFRFAIVASLLVAGLIAYELVARPGGDAPANPVRREVGIRGLIVEPEDGRAPLLAEIDAATRTIDLLMYILSDQIIIDALVAAEDRGVELRVILEKHPFGGAGDAESMTAQLLRAGAEVRHASDHFTFSHAKALVIDGEVALILNLNLARSAFERNREFGVISTWPADVTAVQEAFDADWEDRSHADDSPVVFSPDESRAELAGLIAGARRSIDIYAEVIRDRDVIERLLAAEARGVAVRIVMSPDAAADSVGVAERLAAGGIELRYATDLYIHAKMILVDGQAAFLGSQNLTETSLDENREIGIVVEEDAIIVRLTTLFESDFAAAG
jgi:cardiolipin synthase A/B